MEQDRLLPLHIVAKRLNMETRTIQGWCRDRRIACVQNKVNGRYAIRESVFMSIFVDIAPTGAESHVLEE